MSIFSAFNSKSLTKKRKTYCMDAEAFIQVHFVRERDTERYAFNTLTIKTDPEREACALWYEQHDYPNKFPNIVEIYLNEKKLKASKICSEYKLEARVFTKSSSNCPVEKWEAIAICLGLTLNLSEARALLKIAGYALTNSSRTDLVIRYCFENDIYKLDDINYILLETCERTLNQIA